MNSRQTPHTHARKMDDQSTTTSGHLDTHQDNITGSMSSSGDSSSHADSDDNAGIKFEDWGFQVDRLFEVAYRFYKRNESKAFHPSYDERNQLIALLLQARYGNFDGAKAPDVGTLDLVGRSRRQHWATLKGMSKTEAMSKFILTLNELCPLFRAHVEAVKISCDAQTESDVQNPDVKKDEKLKAIYTSLCRQTYQQFKGYAVKQCPNDVQQQKYLISSLQEQYYQQYISQMHPELNNPSPREQLKSSLSPAASETSSIIHDNVDNVSTTSMKTDQDVNALRSEQISSNIRSDIPETKILTVGNIKENSLIGDNSKPTNPLFEDDLLRTPEIAPPKRVVYEISTAIDEPCLPKPNPYQPSDLQSIGKFESFPKPKPIPNNARPSTETKIIVTKDNQLENKPAYTAIDIGEEPPYLSSAEEAPSDPPPTLPPKELPSPPPQELPPPPILEHEFPALNSCNDLQNIRSETPPSKDLNSQLILSQVSCPEVISENKLPIELWDCDGSSSGSGDSPLEQSVSYEPLEQATIWTKRGSSEFKESLVDDEHGGVYVVKQGTLVTIQVPTYPGGRYIYWEFVTEDYDIGFGLEFVYESNLAKPLAIEIFEETDEDDDEDCDEVGGTNLNRTSYDTEAAAPANPEVSSLAKLRKVKKFARLANTVSIIPTYRRDSHEEIFVGKHKYPGRGYYLLKFDNTYSVLRSKTIFFRICYFI